MKKKVVCLGVALALFFTQVPSFAANAPYNLPKTWEMDNVNKMSVSVEDAIAYGLENSKVLEIVENKVDLARINQESTGNKADEIEDIESSYETSKAAIAATEAEIASAQEALDAAEDALSAGYAPDDIPVLVEEYGLAMTISKGEHIENALKAEFVRLGLDEATATAYAVALAPAVEAGVEETLDGYQDEIDEKVLTVESLEALTDNIYDKVMTDVNDELMSMVNFHSTMDLEVDDIVDLMNDMAQVSLNVTSYAEDVYRNQIAMLITKNYYDALYAEKMVEVKSKALERGKTQYEMVKLSYESGMKAEDDYLLAKMYYDGTIMDLRLSEATYENCMYELKESMNLNMDCDLTLEDDLDMTVRKASLDGALIWGLENRLEIQQILAEMRICLMLIEVMDDENYDSDDYEYEEVMTLYENTLDNLAMAQVVISSDIYQSYELVEATGDMMTASKYLVMEAEEVLEIAKLKYEQGFGSENALLTGMGLGSSSGTILELIAAEENVIAMEAQVAQVRYNHTMARVKFLNDAGILTY